MNVCFYINSSQLGDTDCRFISSGNPGIGGSEFLILLISSLLSCRDNGINVTLYAQNKALFPEKLNIKIKKNAEEAIIDADKNKCDVFIVDQKNIDWFNFDYEELVSNMKIWPWCHNFAKRTLHKLWSRNSHIGRIINVGREQLDIFRDLDSFEKSEYIYNSVLLPSDEIKKVLNLPYNQRRHIVTYMGSLSYGKGFHVLASVWRKIVNKVPDAQLYVIGSGRLYSKDENLGRYGIASENYEELFMKYLIGSDGKVFDSVHFMGALGKEKFDVLCKTKVGVPNPSGNSETFCLSAVEMQLMGCSVVAMESPGYYDTFINGTIVKNKKHLVDEIVRQLLSDSPIADYGDVLKKVESDFSIENVISDWERLLHLNYCQKIHPSFPLCNPHFFLKREKEFMRMLKLRFPIFKILPTCMIIYSVRNYVLKKIFGIYPPQLF